MTSVGCKLGSFEADFSPTTVQATVFPEADLASESEDPTINPDKERSVVKVDPAEVATGSGGNEGPWTQKVDQKTTTCLEIPGRPHYWCLGHRRGSTAELTQKCHQKILTRSPTNRSLNNFRNSNELSELSRRGCLPETRE